MIYTILTKRAIKLMFEAHKDQTDKSGLPYVFHPFHLAEQMEDEITTVVALLHDVVEDTTTTIDDISKMGFGEEICQALTLLTHDKNTPYFDYIQKIKTNPVATAVKLADLKHNSDTTRLDFVGEKERECIEKYSKALDILTTKKSDLQLESPMYKQQTDQAAYSAVAEISIEAVDVRTLEDLIQGLQPFIQKHGGNNESAAGLANYISKKFHAINSPGKWYFCEEYAEYRYQWCACSPFSDNYNEGFIHWKITQIDKFSEGEIINNEPLDSSRAYNDKENFICSNPFGLNGWYKIEYLDER